MIARSPNKNMPHHQCIVCQGRDVVDFFSTPSVPVDVGMLSNSAEEARQATCAPLLLQFCPECGLIRNRVFDPSLIRFAPDYDASLVHSPRMRTANQQLAQSLISKYQLPNKSVLDIGCGQAHLLREICQRTRINAIGIDPTIRTSHETIRDSSLRLIQETFCSKHVELIGDLVLCISVLEDIQHPLRFLLELRQMIAHRRVRLYFELFHGFSAFVNGSVWSPHYEQCNYFSRRSLINLFRRAGFEVTQTGLSPANTQYLYVEAETSAVIWEEPDPTEPEWPVIENYASRVSQQIAEWSERLIKWKAQHKRVCLWGSGGKAISFLSMIPEADTIYSVVDVNPARQGKYTPYSAKPVISSRELRDDRPDIVIASNAAYSSEIQQELREQGMDCPIHLA